MKTEITSARSSRNSASLQSFLNLGLVALILVMANYYGFKHWVHKDLSDSQFYTLSEKTKQVLQKLDSPLKIYTLLDEQNGGPSEQISTLLKEYEHAGKNVIVEKIDPAYDRERATDLQKQLHFDGNDHLIILEYKKDRAPRFVKVEEMYDSEPMMGQAPSFKGEQQITAAIIGLVEGKPSRVYFTEGHGEHSIRDSQPQSSGFGIVAGMLKNENMESASLNLAQKGDVPADAEAIIIAGPRIPFSAIEADALDRYLANNGKLIVLLDPYITLGLDAVLQKYGIKFDDDIVLTRAVSTMGGSLTVPQAVIYQGGFSSNPITAKFAQVNYQMMVMDARSISIPTVSGPTQSKTQFLLQTTPDSWGAIRKSGVAQGDIKSATFDKTRDIPGPVTIAAAYDGGMTTDPATKATKYATRVVAVGMSNFLENDIADTVGANFFTNAVDWLVKKDAVLDIAPKKPQQYGLSLNAISFRTIAWCAGFFIPGAALALGILTWFSRRK